MSSTKPNRLINEQSPYLLQHAHNPVDWYPWGEEAFSTAKASNKPIFLSIGYSTCHWCHVMERESFEDQDIAKIMNENFTNIKVDREERPDVDNQYMSFVVATRGSGGWPLNVFLSPYTLKPFFGGTYFPPRDSYGVPSFRSILSTISKRWSESSEELITSSNRLCDALNEAFASNNRSTRQGSLPEKITTLCDSLYNNMKTSFDQQYGGFSVTEGPKFPTPVQLSFLLAYAQKYDNQNSWNMVEKTLHHIINGGIHDHIGGGFHRYSVDRYWHVPHFEKMLYDQAQLLSILLEAFQYSKNDSYTTIMRKLVRYVSICLMDTDQSSSTFGLFYSAEDADSKDPITGQDKEGAFYTWTEDQIRKILENDSDKFFNCFQLHSEGVLYRSKKADEQFIDICLEKLGTERLNRPKCHKDKKMLVSWNAMMIKALAQACIVEPEWLKLSKDAMDKLIQLVVKDKDKLVTLYHMVNSSLPGFAMDYAHMIDALLTLYRMTFDAQYYILANRLQQSMNELFYYSCDNRCGYSMNMIKSDENSTNSPHFSIFSALTANQDGAEPSIHSIALGNLVALFHLNQDVIDESHSVQDDQYITSLIGDDSLGASLLLRNAMLLIGGKEGFSRNTSTMLIYPLMDDYKHSKLMQVVHKHYLPFCIIAGTKHPLLMEKGTTRLQDKQLSKYPKLLISSVPTKSDDISQKICISICQMNKGCLAPIYSLEELEMFLNK